METPLKDLSFDELLRPEGHACSCGKHHSCGLQYLRVGPGVVKLFPEAMKAIGVRRPFLVMDRNTRKAAGEMVERLLEEAGIDYRSFTFHTDQRIEPDEAAVGAITLAYDPSCDVVVAVGSGVVNDCCKVLAYAAHRPCMVVCTAPSMDGYASNCSAMIQNHVKVSPANACAQAILADTEILATAPDVMLRAGLGDMLAKYVSLCEWKIAHLVHGDPYCPEIAALVRSSFQKVVDNAPDLMQRSDAALAAVVEGLILSGVAMAFAGNSRPASGLEHYFSHVWEMQALARGKTSDLHGVQVGVGTLLTLWIYENILNVDRPDLQAARRAMESFSEEAWRVRVERIFGTTAPEIFALEEKAHKNDPAAHALRLNQIEAHWPEIRKIISEELPRRETVLRLMSSCGMALRPADLGLTAQDTVDAFLGSRDIRDKYLTSSLLWDLGLTEKTADALMALCRKETK